MFRKTMIAFAATAALAGATAGAADAKKKHFDIDIHFGGGGGYGWGPGYGYGGYYGDNDYCGWKVIKKKIWVDTPWGPKKKFIYKKVNTCWY